MKVKTPYRVAGLAMASCLALSACMSSGADGDSADDGTGPIKIGISLPLTGDFSEPGKGVQRGYEAWADYVNENGGLLGRDVELTILDDQSNADRVAADYEKLINSDGVDLVFGPFSTRLVVPAAQVAQDYGFLFVEPAGAAEEVFTQGFDNLFYAAPAIANDHYNYLADAIEALPEDERPATAAYAAMDDPFAMGTAYGLKNRLEEMGVETVVDEVYPPNTTDFGSIAAKIADSEADVVVGGTQYQDAVNMIVALQQLNYQPEMAAFSTAPTNPEFPEAIGDRPRASSPPPATRPTRRSPPTRSSSTSTPRPTAPRPPRTRPTPGPPARSWPRPSRPSSAPAPTPSARASSSTGCVTTRWRPSSARCRGTPRADREGAHLIQQYVDGKIRIVLPEEAKEADLIVAKPRLVTSPGSPRPHPTAHDTYR